MSIATYFEFARNGAAAAPGMVIDSFRGVALQSNNYVQLLAVYYCGQVGDTAQLWLRPALASLPEDTIDLWRSGTPNLLPTNAGRFCYPVPIVALTRVPWVLGVITDCAGNWTVRGWYAMADAGSR